MKKLFTILVIVTLTSLLAFGQWQVVKEQTMDFQANAGNVIDANTVVLVGDDGEVLKTVDGGVSWLTMRAADGSGYDWEDVKFADANVGYATSEKGFIYKTVDGGATWTMIADTANFSVTLKHLAVVSADIVYFAGKDGVLLKTVDGGVNFTKSDSTFDGDDLDGGIAFCSENVGVVQSDGKGGKTWYTHDGGQTWTFVTVAPLFPVGTTSSRIYDVTAYGDSTFAIVGYHYCTFLSTDGGKTYSYIGNVDYGYELGVSIDIINDNTIIIGGNDGYIAKTTDAGASWDTLNIGHGQKINIVDFVDANTGYVFGYYGQWMKTIDGGTNFTPLLDWPQVSFWGLALPEENKIVLSTYAGGELSISVDGGLTWDYPNNYATQVSENLYECEFFDANTGLAGGGYGTLIRTTDGGDTWTAIESPMALVANKHINAIHVYDATTAFAGGSSGYLMKSVDGGLTWTDTKVNSSTVYDIWALDANTVLASESSGKFCYGVFDASGAIVTDSLIMDVGSNSMRAVEVRNGVVLVPASSGKIFRTTTSELDTLYDVFTESDGDDFYDVEFITDDLVYVVGEHGKVYHSEDAGLTWTADISRTTETLQKCRYDGESLWAVGKSGTILKLDRFPGTPYTLPISETADDGYLDLVWTQNEGCYDGGSLSVVDSTASDWGSYVVAFTDSGYTGIAHVDDAVFQDYTVSADIYLIGPADVNAPLYTGLTVKSVHDDLNYYRFVYRNSSSSDNGQLKLQGYDGANWHISAAWNPGVDFPALETGWHNMKITVVGNDFYAYIDGTLLPGCPYHDDSPFLTEGYPGIFKYNSGVSTILFDNFVVDNPEPTPVILTMEVDMSVWTDNGKFDPANDSVDVAGNFNDWGGTPIWLDDSDGDTVYSGVIYGLVFPGDNIEYKFRINGSWNDATCEFPSGGPNRTFTVGNQDTTLFHYYNDDLPSSGIAGDNLLPKKYALHQNYPNPFNPTTTISFDLPKASDVNLTVYNLMGQQVMTLKNEKMNAGSYKIHVDASQLSSGVYFYRIQADGYVNYRKMTLLK